MSHDLRKIIAEWAEQDASELLAVRAETLAKLQHRERVAWDEWEASRMKRKKTSAKKSTRGETQTTETRAEEEDRLGDPRYLERIDWCIAERSRLLGLYADHVLKREEIAAAKALTEAIEHAQRVATTGGTVPNDPPPAPPN